MMNTPNKAIMNSTIEENFNGNHIRLQDEKQPLENQQFKIEDRSFDHQGSIFGCR